MANENENGGLGTIVESIGSLVILVGACTFGYQCFRLVQEGNWPSFEVKDVWIWASLPPPQIKWRGIAKIVEWFLDWPLSVALLFSGVLIISIGGWIREAEKDRPKL